MTTPTKMYYEGWIYPKDITQPATYFQGWINDECRVPSPSTPLLPGMHYIPTLPQASLPMLPGLPQVSYPPQLPQTSVPALPGLPQVCPPPLPQVFPPPLPYVSIEELTKLRELSRSENQCTMITKGVKCTNKFVDPNESMCCENCTQLIANYKLSDDDKDKINTLIVTLISIGKSQNIINIKYVNIEALSADTHELCRTFIPQIEHKIDSSVHRLSSDLVHMWFPGTSICDDEFCDFVCEIEGHVERIFV